MARTKIQMQRMEMRMKLPLKNDTLYVQYFTEVYSEACQTSEMELFAKTVNDLKALQTVIGKSSTLGVDTVLSMPLVSLKAHSKV